MVDVNTNTIGSAYFYYQSIGVVLVSVIVGLVGVALILAKRVTKQGRVIGGLLMVLSGAVIFTTYKISKRPNLIPRQIIPNLRINLRENLIPSEKV